MKLLAPMALLALALLTPTVQAQDPTILDLVVQSAGEVPYTGSGTFAATLTLGCALVLQSAPDLVATISAVDAPAWLTLAPFEVDLQAAVPGCISGGGQTTASASVPFSVSALAPGVEQLSVPLVATVSSQVGDTVSEPAAALYRVAYNSAYTVVADATFPLTMTTPQVTFKVTNTQSSNARSMIMIEGVAVSAGSFAGLPSTVYEVAAGAPASKTFDVTFKAPEGAWERATVSFQAFGHYLLVTGEAGDYAPAQTYTFEFVNGGIPTTPASNGDGKESPAPVAAFTALGLLGLAAALRRKA